MENKNTKVTQIPKRGRGEHRGRSAQARESMGARMKSGMKYFDYSLVAVIVFLICFGLVMLYSASAYSAEVNYSGDSMHYFKRQLFFCIVGGAGAYVVSLCDYHRVAKHAKKIFFFSIFLMALVKTPLGVEVNGATRWIALPFGQQLQPAEVTKIAVIVFVPVVICQMGKEIRTLAGVIRAISWGLLAAGCVYFLTENLSTAVIVLGITCMMVFIVHPKTAPFIALVVLGIIALVVGATILGSMIQAGDLGDNFRLRRIIVWLDPEKHASDYGYQVVQGLYAIGSGGFFGKGLGNSTQKRLIPEVQNDMILSVICEELGVFGAIMVLVLFGLLLYRLMVIAQNAPDMYGALIASGIFSHIALQVFLNVAVVINLIPNTGITLPFISYGGTSLLFLMLEMGVALGISRKIKMQ